MNEDRILRAFRGVGANYTYSSLARELGVTASTVRGYLTGHIRPSQRETYAAMDEVVMAHCEGRTGHLAPARGASISEVRADLKHLVNCGRGFDQKRTPATQAQTRRDVA